jgi:hypothetical protein
VKVKSPEKQKRSLGREAAPALPAMAEDAREAVVVFPLKGGRRTRTDEIIRQVEESTHLTVTADSWSASFHGRAPFAEVCATVEAALPLGWIDYFFPPRDPETGA